MRLPAALLLPLLAACATGAAVPPEQPGAASFRDRGVPIGSTVRGTPADIAGDWVISQAFPGLPFGGAGTRVAVAPAPDGSALWRFDGPGGPARTATVAGLPGRFAPRAEGDLELWILWVDDDFRTAVVGTPDGSLGWIMDRPGQASPDRTAAAREVLDWSGYDLARLAGGA